MPKTTRPKAGYGSLRCPEHNVPLQKKDGFWGSTYWVCPMVSCDYKISDETAEEWANEESGTTITTWTTGEVLSDYAEGAKEKVKEFYGCAISVSILALLRTGSFMPVLAPLVYDFCMWFYPRYGRFLEWLPLPQWMEKYRKAIQNFPQVVEHVYHETPAPKREK